MQAVVSLLGYMPPMPLRASAPIVAPGGGTRTDSVVMKAPARLFKLSDWYGDDWDHKKPADELWVSPWAKAHYKLRQQEIEIEQCEFLLQQAIEAEDYFEADGLKERAERLRSMHPITPREEVRHAMMVTRREHRSQAHLSTHCPSPTARRGSLP